jgi:hypothetical protein
MFTVLIAAQHVALIVALITGLALVALKAEGARNV